jgi:hypothetical protein
MKQEGHDAETDNLEEEGCGVPTELIERLLKRTFVRSGGRSDGKEMREVH